MDFSTYLNRTEKELDSTLPSTPNGDWIEKSFGRLFPASQDNHILPLLEPTRSLVDLGGKRWRPLLLVLCAEAMSIRNGTNAESTAERAFHLAPLVEFIHTASLIHDDIEDNSDTRRGKPAAYISYGLDTALNAASWLYFQASTCIENLDSSSELKEKLHSLYTLEVRRLHLGQAMDIKWHRDKDSCPTQDEYLAMVQCKTGTLSSLAARIGTMLAGADQKTVDKAGAAAAKIGAGFQIIDDVINLETGNPGKKRGDDIVEGKKSLPVLIFINECGKTSERTGELVDCLTRASSEGISSPAVEKAIGLLMESGAVKKAAERGKKFISEGCSDFESIYGQENPSAIRIRELFASMVPKKYLSEENHV